MTQPQLSSTLSLLSGYVLILNRKYHFACLFKIGIFVKGGTGQKKCIPQKWFY
jgi:hypothetical protein